MSDIIGTPLKQIPIKHKKLILKFVSPENKVYKFESPLIPFDRVISVDDVFQILRSFNMNGGIITNLLLNDENGQLCVQSNNPTPTQ